MTENAIERAIVKSARGGVTARAAAQAAYRVLAPRMRELEAERDKAVEDTERLGLEVHELAEERDNARAEVERLRAALANAREQAAADVEAHAKELMDAAIKKVTKDDTDGYSATLRAATVGYVAKYLRGEAGQ